jgi:hypothetical protein
MCDCYRIGGPWIAEDPNCPVHGTEAQRKRKEASDLRSKIENATTFEGLQEVMISLLELIGD